MSSLTSTRNLPLARALCAAVALGTIGLLVAGGPVSTAASAGAAAKWSRDVGESTVGELGKRRVTVRRGIRYAGRDGPALDVYRRATRAAPMPAALVVHGGGWAHGGRRKMVEISRTLALAGIVAFNLDYTLAAPGRPGFPVQLRQLRAAVRWVQRHARRFGGDPSRIGALGTSAGGHLVALLATRASTERGRIAAAVTWSAPLDLPALEHHFMLGPAIGTLTGCNRLTCPERWQAASPLTHVSADDPPMLILNSQREMVPRTQAERMASRLASFGVRHRLSLLDGSEHAIQYSRVAIEPSISFLSHWLR